MAVDSLMAVANQLHAAHHALGDKLIGRQDLPEHYSLDTFYQSVKSSTDVQDFILRAAARLNLPIKWLPDRIAEQNFNLEEPPTKASAWVGVLLSNHLQVFRERLSTMPTLTAADIDQVNQKYCCALSTFTGFAVRSQICIGRIGITTYTRMHVCNRFSKGGQQLP